MGGHGAETPVRGEAEGYANDPDGWKLARFLSGLKVSRG